MMNESRSLTMGAAIAVLAVISSSAPAQAQTEPEGPGDASYYYDPGALVIYGAALGAVASSVFLEPPDTPRIFSPDEGGAPYKGSTVPSWTVGVFAAATGLGMAAVQDEARWYHTKGFLGALATTAFATELTKNLVGRRRPDYDPDNPLAAGEEGRKSFFSGHSSMTWVTTTYLALYLHGHIFPDKRSSGGVAWWEVATYTGLAAISIYVPYSRVLDNRHNPSDILVGSAVGLGTSLLFYYWQNSRYRAAQETDPASLESPSGFAIAPMGAPVGMTMAFTF